MTPRDTAKLYTISIVPEEETGFLFSDNDAERGCIGHLRCDFGKSGKEFWYTWFDHCAGLKSQAFQNELAAVINHLREAGNMLSSLPALAEYCRSHCDARLPLTLRDDSYGFKITTEAHCYYIRGLLAHGDYNVYCYCFSRGRLERFLAAAQPEEGKSWI